MTIICSIPSLPLASAIVTTHIILTLEAYDKIDFPKFDGDDYQVQLDNCELYFEIYGVSEQMKVKFVTLN